MSSLTVALINDETIQCYPGDDGSDVDKNNDVIEHEIIHTQSQISEALVTASRAGLFNKTVLDASNSLGNASLVEPADATAIQIQTQLM